MRHHVMSAWACSFITGYREKPAIIVYINSTKMSSCFTWRNIAWPKRRETNSTAAKGGIKQCVKQIKRKPQWRRAARFVHSFTDIEALSGALGAETPLTRLVFLYIVNNAQKQLLLIQNLCGQQTKICLLGRNLNILTSFLPVLWMTAADFAYGEVGGNLAVGLLRIRVFSR